MQFTTAPEYETVIKSIISHFVVSTKKLIIKKKERENFKLPTILAHTR